jgi:S-formylglutathione hydrolase
MQRYAAEQGIALIFPDTSPRGENIADVPERYDLGQGAGFYVNATQKPWSKHYQMFTYVTQELPALVEKNLAIQANVKSISGHSMGGHGALICALKKPESYCSVSTFSPIANPVECDWGKACFSAYLGTDKQTWQTYDATQLLADGAKFTDILIEQGTADEFYDEGQLLPENFQAACTQAGQNLTLRMQQAYDHSYHFVASFIGEHIVYHARALKNCAGDDFPC